MPSVFAAARSLDLSSWLFYAGAAFAILLLAPLKHAGLRRLALAGVNLAFIALILGRGAALVVVGLGVAYLLCYAIRHTGFPAALAGLLGVGALFMLHKLPGIASSLHVSFISPVLAAVGFSYVFLRTIDLFRALQEKRYPAPDPLSLVNYLVPFHMLAAGPIQSYDDFAAQDPVPAPLRFAEALEAMERIAAGLFKKFVLAAALQRFFSTGWQVAGWYWFLEMQVHFVWIYLDFSAYTDIAVGLGRLMGVATPENFNRPFMARNLTEFWERWHISLSLFIRRHLFIPIQLWLVRRAGPRHSIACACVAIFVAFLCCGAWHGLTLPFVAWGGAHGVGLLTCILYREYCKRKFGKRKRGGAADAARDWLSRAITFEFVAFSLMLVGYQWRNPW